MLSSKIAFTAPGKLRLYSTAELMQLPPPEWLIHGIMPTRGVIGLYGPPGIGKSFLALDFALSVATGTPWQGRPVKKGPVLYIAAEGGTGMGKRSAAWLLDRGVGAEQGIVMWLLEAIPVYGDSNDMDHIMERIVNEVQVQPRVVVIDTLARCFDGDENKQEDMGRFITGADRFCTEFDAAVIVVHHTRLDGKRERGNTAFRGAAETMLQMEKRKDPQRHTRLWLRCNKQKDAEEFKEIELKLQPVEETNSCVIRTTGVRNAQTFARLNVVLDLLKHKPLTAKEWALAAARKHVSKSTFFCAMSRSKKNRKIIKEKGKYRLLNLPSPVDPAQTV